MEKIKVVELFAGVGGFRIGLEGYPKRKNSKYEVVWSNQWEPSTKVQHASEIYVKNFGERNHSNEDIQKVIEKNFEEIPDHDLLVGGFPCQDYSVARTLSQAKGLRGKKGVLWWSIYEILKKKIDEEKNGKKKNSAPRYLFLENVDRLLKSPATQRGRDFAIMLASLSDLGYAVEWRVINAADYGMPQRRRRIFILGYRENTNIYKSIKKAKSLTEWLLTQSTSVLGFPIKKECFPEPEFTIEGSIPDISSDFSKNSKKSPFELAGVMIDRKVATVKVFPKYKGKTTTLGDIVNETNEADVPNDFFLDKEDIAKWEYLKNKKNETRESKSGHTYTYSEGSMPFPDILDKPSRTIVTGEGGKGPSRFKHVVQKPKGKLRRLTPVELEKLDMFPADFTKEMLDGKITSDGKRAFIMGNALVVGVIDKFGEALEKKMTEGETSRSKKSL